MNYWTCLTKIHSMLFKAVFAAACLLSSVHATDFGVAQWGMSIDEVKQLETRSNLTPFGQSNYLIYAISLNAIEITRIIYQFENGQLTQGRFVFSPKNAFDVQRALMQYQSIKTMLNGQYGPPNTDEVLTANSDSMALVPENYANELASDRLILKSSWRSPTATLKHQIAWFNGRPHHQLVYLPTNPQSSSTSGEAF